MLDHRMPISSADPALVHRLRKKSSKPAPLSPATAQRERSNQDTTSFGIRAPPVQCDSSTCRIFLSRRCGAVKKQNTNIFGKRTGASRIGLRSMLLTVLFGSVQAAMSQEQVARYEAHAQVLFEKVRNLKETVRKGEVSLESSQKEVAELRAKLAERERVKEVDSDDFSEELGKLNEQGEIDQLRTENARLEKKLYAQSISSCSHCDSAKEHAESLEVALKKSASEIGELQEKISNLENNPTPIISKQPECKKCKALDIRCEVQNRKVVEQEAELKKLRQRCAELEAPKNRKRSRSLKRRDSMSPTRGRSNVAVLTLMKPNIDNDVTQQGGSVKRVFETRKSNIRIWTKGTRARQDSRWCGISLPQQRKLTYEYHPAENNYVLTIPVEKLKPVLLDAKGERLEIRFDSEVHLDKDKKSALKWHSCEVLNAKRAGEKGAVKIVYTLSQPLISV